MHQLMHILIFYFMLAVPSDKELDTAITVIAPSKLSPSYKRKIIRAIKSTTENTKLDPYLLIAIMRAESDFLPVYRLWPECKQKNSQRCRADCGITQHHLTGPKHKVIRYCKKLVKKPALAVRHSVKELLYHFSWCEKKADNKYYSPLLRCVLNRYNAGPKYRTRELCNRKWGWRCIIKCPTDERLYRERKKCIQRCYKKRNRCLYYAGYWKRVLCFLHGAKTGKTPTKNCRKMTTLSKVEDFYR